MSNVPALINGIPQEALNVTGKKFVEIVTRNSKGQIVKITKCAVENLSKQGASRLIGAVANGPLGGVNLVSSLANNVQTEMVRRAVKEVGKKVDIMSSTLTMMSSKLNVVTNLSFLNAGLGIANLAVSAVGFKIMNDKLNALKLTVDEIGDNVKQILYIEKFTLEREFDKLKGRCITVMTHIIDNEYDEHEVLDLTNDLSAYIKNIQKLYIAKAIDRDKGYLIIKYLLCAYEKFVEVYFTEYYREKGRLPLLKKKELLSLHNEICTEEFFDSIFQYVFYDYNLGTIEAREAEFVAINTFSEGAVELHNMCELMECFNDKDAYFKLVDNIKENAKKEVIALLPTAMPKDQSYNYNDVLEIINEF